jgi:hypothetical protein
MRAARIRVESLEDRYIIYNFNDAVKTSTSFKDIPDWMQSSMALLDIAGGGNEIQGIELKPDLPGKIYYLTIKGHLPNDSK